MGERVKVEVFVMSIKKQNDASFSRQMQVDSRPADEKPFQFGKPVRSAIGGMGEAEKIIAGGPSQRMAEDGSMASRLPGDHGKKYGMETTARRDIGIGITPVDMERRSRDA